MTELDELAREFRAGIDRLDTVLSRVPQGGNTNVVKLEGAGSIWNGIAIGVALGAAIVCTAWVASTVQDNQVRAQQAEAYAKAVYMLAPRFAEEIDKELDRSKKEPR
jgi:hypothetical protein